jgi:hypothetical protein
MIPHARSLGYSLTRTLATATLLHMFSHCIFTVILYKLVGLKLASWYKYHRTLQVALAVAPVALLVVVMCSSLQHLR